MSSVGTNGLRATTATVLCHGTIWWGLYWWQFSIIWEKVLVRIKPMIRIIILILYNLISTITTEWKNN